MASSTPPTSTMTTDTPSPILFANFDYAFLPVAAAADPVVTKINAAANLVAPWMVDSAWLARKREQRGQFVLSPVYESTIVQRRLKSGPSTPEVET
ncbi:hypothetical protein LTR62_004722 [Meristemomyces frigidus]|uniref:Uncharacterized protein n=1 Tax=Meristemomyces frigidus TaxID=1508187 RepID=A0AAN7THD7_9PEZI|nr:hypothetical protein LTR62_004722 [Meristemomyces frigidus]